MVIGDGINAHNSLTRITSTLHLNSHRHDNTNMIGGSGNGWGFDHPGTSFISQFNQDLIGLHHIQGFHYISCIKSNFEGRSLISNLQLLLGISKILMNGGEFQ